VDRNEPLAREVRVLRDILREIELEGRHYCVLQPEESGEEDAYIFRVGDDHKIEHVEDEEEWERAAEAVDELLYFDEN